MKKKHKQQCDPGYCLFGAQVILPLLSALDDEIEGVKQAEDIEYVHRCRVATRRIRAAMPLFEENCFQSKNSKKWQRAIRDVTRALGEARDADVQIDFIANILRDLEAEDSNSTPVFLLEGSPLSSQEVSVISVARQTVRTNPLWDRLRMWFFGQKSPPQRDLIHSENTNGEIRFAGENPYQTGIECLLLRLQQHRNALQQGVVTAMEKFEGTGVLLEMQQYLHSFIVKGKMQATDIHSPYAFEKAFYHISMCLEDLFSYERFIDDPEKVAQHHQMRIAAKHLRYTLEAYAGLYPRGLKQEIRTFKHLQDILGDIHDCDVWAAFLEDFIEEEKDRSQSYFGNHHFFSLCLPGLNYLHDGRVSTRQKLHRDLVTTWKKLQDDGFWEVLRETISLPLRNSFHHMIDVRENETLVLALIGDIHANLPALEAVLSDARSRGATAVLNVGDSIGYGAFPEETVDLIRFEHIISTIGNYDISVLEKKWQKKSKKKKPQNLQKKRAMKWAYKNLSAANRDYLRMLPKELRLTLLGKRILATHGSPDFLTEYISEETPQKRLREIAQTAGADIIVAGHSHQPFAKETEGVWLINTGSVGRPEDGDPRACYALLTLNPFSLHHIRVPYDINRAVEGIYQKNLPEPFARVFQEGKPLDVFRYKSEN